jgi:hypothetical protein
MHASVQALSQHTPWAQNPDLHSFAVVQSAPGGFGPHEPFTQNWPEAHWSLVLHALKQTLPLQANGLQVRDGEATHCPEALQVAGGV